MDNLDGKVDSAGPPTGVLTAAEWNQLANELKNFIDSHTAQTPASGDLNQLSKGVAQFSASSDYYTGGGTANAQTLTIVGRPGATALATGLRVRWKPSVANTGAATIDVNGLGATSITRFDGTVLQAGDIAVGRFAEAWYEGGNFRLSNGSLSIPSPALPSGYITGLAFSPPASDLTHDVTFPVGQCRDATNAVNLVLSTALTKRFDGTPIALGTGQTGFPTVSLTRAAATWYRVFIVGHVDGRVDFGFDTSTTAAYLRADLVSIDSAGWNYYRQLGWIRTAGTDDFIPFVQYAARPGRFHWIDGNLLIGASASLVTTRTARSLDSLVPPLSVAHVSVLIEPPSGAASERRNLLLTDKDQADYAPTNSRFTLTTKSAAGPGNNAWTHIGTVEVRVDSASEIYERWDAANSWERTLLIPRWDFDR